MTKRTGSSATKCTMRTSNRMPSKRRVLSKQKHSKYRTHLSKKRRKQTQLLGCNDKTRHNKQYTKYLLTNTRKTHPSKNSGGRHLFTVDTNEMDKVKRFMTLTEEGCCRGDRGVDDAMGGLFVSGMMDNAHDAQVAVGDKLVNIDGKPCNSLTEFRSLYIEGKEQTFQLSRNGPYEIQEFSMLQYVNRANAINNAIMDASSHLTIGNFIFAGLILTILKQYNYLARTVEFKRFQEVSKDIISLKGLNESLLRSSVNTNERHEGFNFETATNIFETTHNGDRALNRLLNRLDPEKIIAFHRWFYENEHRLQISNMKVPIYISIHDMVEERILCGNENSSSSAKFLQLIEHCDDHTSPQITSAKQKSFDDTLKYIHNKLDRMAKKVPFQTRYLGVYKKLFEEGNTVIYRTMGTELAKKKEHPGQYSRLHNRKPTYKHETEDIYCYYYVPGEEEAKQDDSKNIDERQNTGRWLFGPISGKADALFSIQENTETPDVTTVPVESYSDEKDWTMGYVAVTAYKDDNIKLSAAFNQEYLGVYRRRYKYRGQSVPNDFNGKPTYVHCAHNIYCYYYVPDLEEAKQDEKKAIQRSDDDQRRRQLREERERKVTRIIDSNTGEWLFGPKIGEAGAFLSIRQNTETPDVATVPVESYTQYVNDRQWISDRVITISENNRFEIVRVGSLS